MTTYLATEQWGGHRNGWGSMQLPAQEDWVHHSVTQRTGDAISDLQTLDGIGLSRGHGGISYSFGIEGAVVGEGQGLNIGAHTYGRNGFSFGVVFIGNFMEMELTGADIDSYRWLRQRRIEDGVLPPWVFPTGGHRDAPNNSTACPGDNVWNNINLLREAVGGPPLPSQPAEENGMLLRVSVRSNADASQEVGIGWLADGMLFTAVSIDAGAPFGDIMMFVSEFSARIAAQNTVPTFSGGSGGGGTGISEARAKELIAASRLTP